MSQTVIGAYEGMNQPPLTSASRPDLAALPAYVEPPRQVTKIDRTKNSAFTILVIALGAGVCGGVALNEYKERAPAVDMPFQRFAAAAAEIPAPEVTRPAEVPLPVGVQTVRQVATKPAPPTTASHLIASRHPGNDHNRPQPARLTRPSNGYAGSL